MSPAEAGAAVSAAFEQLARDAFGEAQSATARLEAMKSGNQNALDSATSLKVATLRELISVWTELPEPLRQAMARALARAELRADDAQVTLFAAGDPRAASAAKAVLQSRAPALHSHFGSALAPVAEDFRPEVSPRTWIRYARIALFFVALFFVALKACERG